VSLLEKPYDLAAGAAFEGDPNSGRRRQEDRAGRVAPGSSLAIARKRGILRANVTGA
jgi:hypothetical protein